MSLFRLHGVSLKHSKHTSDCAPERIPVPMAVTIPMVMHLGAPAVPVVKTGDLVSVGQLIAEAGGRVSAPIYASVSGKVKGIDTITDSTGKQINAVTIESDGLQTVSETVLPRTIESKSDFIAAVKDSGVVGLGGAGFPTFVKLDVPDGSVDTIVVNGAECEPYITSDTRTMIDRADDVANGIKLLVKYLGVKRVIVGIEANKPQCIASMKDACKDIPEAEIKKLPSVYPQGGEKVLAYHAAGKVIPEGKLPLDAGVIIINCTSLAVIAKFIETGMPLVEKCITVDGSAVKTPKNVIAPIGTPIKNLFDFCDGFKEEPKKILYGGPMMGIAVPDINVPVLKQTNAVLAFNAKDGILPEESACIKCGRCSNICPFGLMPDGIEKAYNDKDGEKLAKTKVNLCMECGCCSYVCPAKRHIVQTNKLAKAFLRDYQTSKKGGDK